MVRRGSWLKTIAGFKCDSCRSRVRIGYEEKLAIFERHLRKVSASTKSTTALVSGRFRDRVQWVHGLFPAILFSPGPATVYYRRLGRYHLLSGLAMECLGR
ncbi:hypothetical protein X769_26565 [Mesorhizobium sp. LSJC268A00]|nr:hypothetical protein X769_26565 [Mesorhizobium sp. LSJC268A00]